MGDDKKGVFDSVHLGYYKNVRFNPIDICKDIVPVTDLDSLELVHLDKDASTKEVLADLEKRGLRPALYEELFVYAAKYPGKQHEFSIAALGSFFYYDYGFSSPCVVWGGVEAHLRRGCRGESWSKDWRFLAVRKH